MKASDVDDYGRVQLDLASVFRMMNTGLSVRDVHVQDNKHLQLYNDLCTRWDRSEYKLSSPPQMPHSAAVEHQIRQANWLFPEELTEIDVRDYVIGLCTSDVQRERVHAEMDLYERHELIPVLHLMMFLVMHFRSNKIVYGVGRGSSVASYVLFKLGVHKIDSLKYNLAIEDFLKG